MQTMAAGPVPRGIPAASVQGYPHLERNQLGAIDMSRYTRGQWLATGLPYCKACMTSPAQVAPQREPYWDYWNGYMSVEPCPHGHIMTAERVYLQIESKKHRDIFWSIVCIVIGLAFGIRLGTWGWIGMAALTAFAVWAFRGYRRAGYKVIGLLQQHPEIYGYWQPNKKGNQPWINR